MISAVRPISGFIRSPPLLELLVVNLSAFGQPNVVRARSSYPRLEALLPGVVLRAITLTVL